MTSKIKIIFVIVFVVVFAYWGLMEYFAYKFEQSKLGQELTQAMQACRDAQMEGMLPGIPSGDLSDKLTVEGDHYDYEDRHEVSYPIQTGCTVTYDDQKTTFHLRKENKDAQWIVIGADPDGIGSIPRPR